MIRIRRANERGHADHGWLDSHHTFSFADYHDPAHMGFRSLRVINEDRVAGGNGFPTHGHRDMEIISYVLEGAIEHKDSMGNGSVLRPGHFQRMSAGSGVMHSEFNHSPTETVHFYQIWILPNATGVAPGYEELHLDIAAPTKGLRLVASPDGHAGSLAIHQDARIHHAILAAGESVSLAIVPGRHAWLQVVRGAVTANGTALAESDGAAFSEEPTVNVSATEPAEVLLFDLA